MISICPRVQDTSFIVLAELAASEIKKYARRVSRTATLDGDSVITDSGYTDSDRVIEIRANVTAAQEATIQYLLETYSLLSVSTPDGCYTCAPNTWAFHGMSSPDEGQCYINMLILE